MDGSWLRLAEDEDGRHILLETQSDVGWPPPEELWLVTTENDIRSQWFRSPWLGEFEHMNGCTFNAEIPDLLVTPFVRTKYSKLGDDVAASPHVIRGALYTPRP